MCPDRDQTGGGRGGGVGAQRAIANRCFKVAPGNEPSFTFVLRFRFRRLDGMFPCPPVASLAAVTVEHLRATAKRIIVNQSTVCQLAHNTKHIRISIACLSLFPTLPPFSPPPLFLHAPMNHSPTHSLTQCRHTHTQTHTTASGRSLASLLLILLPIESLPPSSRHRPVFSVAALPAFRSGDEPMSTDATVSSSAAALMTELDRADGPSPLAIPHPSSPKACRSAVTYTMKPPLFSTAAY